jgi:undecaprenyl diphosphate synthase
MNLVLSTVSKHLERLKEQGVRIYIVGDRTQVSDSVRDAWAQAEGATAHNRRLTLSVAFNYGGRWDIVQAAQAAVRPGLGPDGLSEASLARFLALSHTPDPDLFIRTGGEVRISNFLLWQVAYSELNFTDCLWPDFDEVQLDAALAEYARRERRFGDVSDVPSEGA